MSVIRQYRNCPRCTRMVENTSPNCPFCGTSTPTPQPTPLPLSPYGSPYSAYSPLFGGGYMPMTPFAWPGVPSPNFSYTQPGVVSSTAHCPRCGRFNFTDTCGACGYALDNVDREVHFARSPTPGGQLLPWEKEDDKPEPPKRTRTPERARAWKRMEDQKKEEKRQFPYHPATAYDILASPMPPTPMSPWTLSPLSPTRGRAPLPTPVITDPARFSRVRTPPPTKTRAPVRGVKPDPKQVPPTRNPNPPPPLPVAVTPTREAAAPAAPSVQDSPDPQQDASVRRRRTTTRDSDSSSSAPPPAPIASPTPERGASIRRRRFGTTDGNAPPSTRRTTPPPTVRNSAPPTTRPRRASFNADPVASVRTISDSHVPRRSPSPKGIPRLKSIMKNRTRRADDEDPDWSSESETDEVTAFHTANRTSPQTTTSNPPPENPVPAASSNAQQATVEDWEFIMPMFVVPVAKIQRMREPFDDILDGELSHVDHPAGSEALVYPTGAPTPKLRHLVEAMYLWIAQSEPEDHHYVSVKRLKFLEASAMNWGFYYTYHEATWADAYQYLGLEYAIIGNQPALTYKGLLRYVTLWILCEPRLACPILRSLTQKEGFQHPMNQWKGNLWRIDTSMTVSSVHPDAIRWRTALHAQMLQKNAVHRGRWETPLWVMANQV